MKTLVFGGTRFLSHAVAGEAVRRGHEVVCAARGESGPVPPGARLIRVDRDDPDGLKPLVGEHFDAVVDTSIMSHRWVADALRAVAEKAGHWTFVSSVSVYADHSQPGQTVHSPLLQPRPVHATLADRDGDPDLYGAVKVAGENTVREVLADRAFIARAGLLVGPGDLTDRFGYWPTRFARGGRVLVPDTPDLPAQYVDVADLAAWIIGSGERGLTGTFDAIGPSRPLPDLLRAIADVVGVDVDLVPMTEAALEAAGVQAWMGPRSLPLWLPRSHFGMCAHDERPALDAGLSPRPLDEVVLRALAYERERGVDRERRAGLLPAEEAEVLAGAL